MENTPEVRKAYWEQHEEYAIIALNLARRMLGKAPVEFEVIPEYNGAQDGTPAQPANP